MSHAGLPKLGACGTLAAWREFCHTTLPPLCCLSAPAGSPRAYNIPDRFHPEEDGAEPRTRQTVLQQHVEFFDYVSRRTAHSNCWCCQCSATRLVCCSYYQAAAGDPSDCAFGVCCLLPDLCAACAGQGWCDLAVGHCPWLPGHWLQSTHLRTGTFLHPHR